MSDPSPLEANAYAVTYRLLGDVAEARAAAGVATARLEHGAHDPNRHWLYTLTDLAVAASVGVADGRSGAPDAGAPDAGAPDAGAADTRAPGGRATDDASAGLRAALRRRLVNATPDERVAGALVHLAGYPPEFVADVVATTPESAVRAAAVLAPPPGVDYRDLGDPSLTGSASSRRAGRSRSRMRRPHWTTIAAVAVVAAAVIAATQVTGPRPTLGPPIDEGGMGAVVAEPPDNAPAHLNGGPPIQATKD